MDWQFKVGLGLALVFGLLPFAVKDMPHWVTWPGISIGILFIIWGILPAHQKIQIGPAILFIAGFAAIVGSVAWYSIANQDNIKAEKQPTAEEIAKEVVKQPPDQPTEEVNRPYFTVEPKLIMDKFNNVEWLDLIITNAGKNPANPTFGYTFIFQFHQIPILGVHPQSFTNDFVVGLPKVIHELTIKKMELKGYQYVFLYLHYTDIISKEKYSQSFYFERVIYKNGLIEYADASTEHKKEMDGMRKAPPCSIVEELVNSGADESTFRAAMEERGYKVHDISDF